jgi:PAS domain S-box-containing protein
VLAGTILLVALGTAATFWVLRQLETARPEHQRVITLTDRAEELLRAVGDAETGQRGFCLTGDETFLAPYLSVRDKVAAERRELLPLTKLDAAHQRLNAVNPILEEKMRSMTAVIELRRRGDLPGVISAVSSRKGKQWMDSIRAEFTGCIQIERAGSGRRDAQFLAQMRRLFAIAVAVAVGLLAALAVLAFAFLFYRETQHRIKALLHRETQRLLELRTDTADRLQQANATLLISQNQLVASLKDNGDLKTALDEHAIVAITDSRGRIGSVNDKFCAISQSTRAELVGQDHRLINSGHHPPEFIHALWTTLTRGHVGHGEIKDRAQDGSFYSVDTTIVPFLGDEGQPRQYLAIRADITERKQVEPSCGPATIACVWRPRRPAWALGNGIF